MMRQTLQPSLIASGRGRTILIAGGERGVIYNDMPWYGLTRAVWRKAQQYGVWPEVLRWAKEHPLAVKWLNQDTDMIHSIAETGWTRWIKNNGTAFLDLGVTPNQTFDFELSYVSHRVLGGIIGAWQSWSGSSCLVADQGSGGVTIYYDGNQTSQTLKLNAANIMTATKDYFEVNGTRKALKGVILNFRGNIRVFTSGGRTCNGDMSYVIIRGDYPFHLVPHIQEDGTIGMVDLLTGTFHKNANTTGSFTIELTKNE